MREIEKGKGSEGWWLYRIEGTADGCVFVIVVSMPLWLSIIWYGETRVHVGAYGGKYNGRDHALTEWLEEGSGDTRFT